MTTRTGFDLNAVLHEAAESTESPDPAEVSKAAFTAIDPDDYPEALRQALDLYTPHYIVKTRPTRLGTRTKKRTKRPVGSRRVARARRFLGSREWSPLRGDWILLADATANDLRSMAESRYALAGQVMAKARWFERCVDEVERYEVEKFGDLPETVVDDLMYGEPEEEE